MRFRTVLLNTVGALVLWTSAGAQTQGGTGPYSVSIPAEPLGDALNELAQQTGLQILFSSELVARMRAPQVKGSLSADEALRKILSNSGLRFEFVNPRTIAILGPQATGKKLSESTVEGDAGSASPLDTTDESSIQSREAIMPHKSLMARFLAVFAVCSSGMHGGAACAQELNAHGSANAPTELEEVVVTAQKRSESIQQVPIAITAFSESTLRAKGITDIHGLSALTPNVNLDQGSPFSGSNSVLSASIRGIGQDDFAFNLDPGVGVYVDGVYFARTVGANQSLLDVERIEILKGPQGTLFGRNTIGGAISIVTRAPGSEFTIQTQATGGSYNRRDVSVLADIPLAPNLLSAVTVATQYQDGYQRRIPYPSPTPYVSDPVGAYPRRQQSANRARQAGVEGLGFADHDRCRRLDPHQSALDGQHRAANRDAIFARRDLRSVLQRLPSGAPTRYRPHLRAARRGRYVPVAGQLEPRVDPPAVRAGGDQDRKHRYDLCQRAEL